MTDLEKSILATLVYYDVLDRPLTGWEVFRFLVRGEKNETTLNSVLTSLENSPELTNLISQQKGFYFFKGRSRIVKERISRQKIADRKWKKARQVLKLLQTIPFIRLVAVSGSLAMNNPKPESDIDLLIVTKASRIWTCRALTTLFFQSVGQRRHGSLTKDRFCLNHYLTDKSLKIPFKSLYNAQTYAHLVPIWEAKSPKLYQRFQKANQWIGDYLAYYPASQKGYLTIINPSRFLTDVRTFREIVLSGWLGDIIEFALKKIQQRRIKKDPLTYQSGGRVLFDDKQLEFHPDSPEKGILEKYNQEMRKLGLPEMGEEKDSGLNLG